MLAIEMVGHGTLIIGVAAFAGRGGIFCHAGDKMGMNTHNVKEASDDVFSHKVVIASWRLASYTKPILLILS